MKPRFLILETHHLGDAVLSVPLVRGALQKGEVLVICRPEQRAVYDQVPESGLAIETWEPAWMADEGGAPGDSLSRFRKIARSWRPDFAVSCWPDLRVHWLLRESGAARRVGFPMTAGNLHAMHLPWRRKRLRWPALADRLATPLLLSDSLAGDPAHPAQLHSWRQIAGRTETPFVETTPWLRAGELPAELASRIAEARATKSPIWLLHGGARAPMRRWPAEHFLEIGRRLRERDNAAVLTVGLPPAPGLYSWQPTSISEFLAGAAASDAVLCNDSFPAHAAAAMGTAVWTIFTAQEPARFAPFNNEQRAISAAICPIRPCLDRCLRPSYECLEAVTVELVWQQIVGNPLDF